MRGLRILAAAVMGGLALLLLAMSETVDASPGQIDLLFGSGLVLVFWSGSVVGALVSERPRHGR